MIKYLLAIVMLFAVPAISSAFMEPTASATAKVVDEDGKPIPDAEVHISFIVNAKREWGMGTNMKRGVSGADGMWYAEGNSAMPEVSVSAIKAGYYKSGTGFNFHTRSILNRWEPWNPTVEVVLKKERNPVAMYNKRTEGLKIPVFDKPVGFDLEKGDWIAPYGKGLVADLIFAFWVNDRSYKDYECGFTLTFSNTSDGIQEYWPSKDDQSYYKWPFEAPETGYISQVSKEKEMRPDKPYRSNEKDHVSYLFRVRTQVDANGKVVSARYGKIGGEFGFDPAGSLVFNYYFNPDGTRNLEHDEKRNLFERKARK
jgi:hypothetical protein